MTWQDLTTTEIIEFCYVQDWLAEIAMLHTGSEKTRLHYVKLSTDYCNWRKKTPAELLEEDRPYREGKKITVAEQQLTRYFQWKTLQSLEVNQISEYPLKFY